MHSFLQFRRHINPDAIDRDLDLVPPGGVLTSLRDIQARGWRFNRLAYLGHGITSPCVQWVLLYDYDMRYLEVKQVQQVK
jgi:hypothetical protein